ncbi:hypothetical protein CO614_11430 [Lysobacteraceae bacterium NML120232]|nr:hypothetical protein CO614_11430 [Xanthomonadaceae bacterium NML120232]PJK10949.1 hypothetical protein CO608_00250 [Xanthomonadaceae bacterium NML08-0793]
MKASIFYAVLVAGLYGAAASASAQEAAGYWNRDMGAASHFICESHDGRYRECRADLRGQRVRLVRQLSRNACIEGRTWGSHYNGVWVNGGCRAEFEASSGYGYGRDYGRDRDWRDRGDNRWGNRPGTHVICESFGSRHNRCAIDTSRGVTLVRQISSTRCREGHNWGVGNGDVWVDHGCRAEFAARGNDRHYGYNPGGGWNGGYDSGYGYGRSPQMLQCASTDGRQSFCRVDASRGVELVRQISRSACIEGHSWGWNRTGIWVSNGCRAEFRVW